MMFTGGAMSMIAAGGRQKSLSEWAESILRWFEGLRPGNKRGKGFDYGELMAQYFPGSNIDAWFNVNGVPQNMRDYWWTYALAKANKTADTGDDGCGYHDRHRREQRRLAAPARRRPSSPAPSSPWPVRCRVSTPSVSHRTAGSTS